MQRTEPVRCQAAAYGMQVGSYVKLGHSWAKMGWVIIRLKDKTKEIIFFNILEILLNRL